MSMNNLYRAHHKPYIEEVLKCKDLDERSCCEKYKNRN